MRRGTLAAVAKLVIVVMRSNDQQHCNGEEEVFVLFKKLFQYQKTKAGGKNVNRYVVVMVLNKPMIQGVHAYKKSQRYHAPFKKGIVHYINTKHRQGCCKRRQQCTVNGTYYRCGNPHFIPVQFQFHFFAEGKYTIFAILLQNIKTVLLHKAVCSSLILKKFYA